MEKLAITAAIGIVSTAASVGAIPPPATIAYDNSSTTSALQNYGNNLGLDFTVNSPIKVTALGAFDNGDTANLDGVIGGGIDVGIFDFGSQNLVGSPVHLSSSISGTQINANAFLPANILLAPGNYSVVAFNDGNFNSNGGFNPISIENDGGGLISFFGGGRYSDGGATSLAFPPHPDGGPTNRYDAGTFQFTAIPEPASVALLTLGGVGLLARRRRA